MQTQTLNINYGNSYMLELNVSKDMKKIVNNAKREFEHIF